MELAEAAGQVEGSRRDQLAPPGVVNELSSPGGNLSSYQQGVPESHDCISRFVFFFPSWLPGLCKNVFVSGCLRERMGLRVYSWKFD